ncbi:uncharacterized protein LY79DRAFT_161702 [Colletotrichum navitas]|uniref:Uncharacterized protein n=1 Tax=Colletotrichum navitas TaxID=681940 RepID=A0AAD8Q1Y9_9PEZI|nr:uncharacterized protein LY79DRAFT_161702 [Colletotrichum navitas]KAK1594203.1 hypothetical protein LY79DRAFT_161702 [Colletotrichum navitas]
MNEWMRCVARPTLPCAKAQPQSGAVLPFSIGNCVRVWPSFPPFPSLTLSLFSIRHLTEMEKKKKKKEKKKIENGPCATGEVKANIWLKLDIRKVNTNPITDTYKVYAQETLKMVVGFSTRRQQIPVTCQADATCNNSTQLRVHQTAQKSSRTSFCQGGKGPWFLGLAWLFCLSAASFSRMPNVWRRRQQGQD